MPGFWDASAIVPLCIPGPGGTRWRKLLHKYPPVVWWGTRVEVASAIQRLGREALLTPVQQDAAHERLSMLSRSWREVEPTERLRDLAQTVLKRYELRAGDALQLGAALAWCRQHPKQRPFLCSDSRLRAAAFQEGFAVVEV